MTHVTEMYRTWGPGTQDGGWDKYQGMEAYAINGFHKNKCGRTTHPVAGESGRTKYVVFDACTLRLFTRVYTCSLRFTFFNSSLHSFTPVYHLFTPVWSN